MVTRGRETVLSRDVPVSPFGIERGKSCEEECLENHRRDVGGSGDFDNHQVDRSVAGVDDQARIDRQGPTSLVEAGGGRGSAPPHGDRPRPGARRPCRYCCVEERSPQAHRPRGFFFFYADCCESLLSAKLGQLTASQFTVWGFDLLKDS